MSPATDNIPSPRKRADFPQVFRHERTLANRLRETSRYVGGRNACWCGSRTCARLALHRMEERLAGMVQKQVTAQGGWGRRPEGDAPRSEASALGARWLLPARPQPPSYCHLRG